MSVATVQTFYAVLAMAAIVVIVVLASLRLASVWSAAARGWYETAAEVLEPHAITLAFGVAVLATAGSLFFSEVARFEPCRLCWYQRIGMYPLVVILAVAAAFRDRGGTRYAIALAMVGAVIASYHVALEWIPALDTGACAAGTPCTLVWFREFGFISLPTLSLTAFLLILTLLTVRSRRTT